MVDGINSGNKNGRIILIDIIDNGHPFYLGIIHIIIGRGVANCSQFEVGGKDTPPVSVGGGLVK